MIVKFIDYSKDYLRFKTEYDKVWEDINMRGDLLLRKDTEEFEQRLAKYVGTKFAVALSSGTAAIFLALKALNIKGKVALPSHTFKSTCGAVLDAGCEPIIYDMDGKIPDGIFPDACIPVHIAGELTNLVTEIPIIIEDACFPAGTMVLTNKGEKPIETIKIGDRVLTRQGYKKVLISKMTGYKKVINRFGIIATSNHPFITKKGIKTFDTLNGCDTIYKWNEKLLYIEEKNIIDIQNQINEKREFIIGDMIPINHRFLYIDKFGLITLVKLIKVLWYTIKTKIHLIMRFQILNYVSIPNIVGGTVSKGYIPVLKSLQSPYEISNLVEQKQMNGIGGKEVRQLVEKMLTFFGTKNFIQRCVNYVINHIKLVFLKSQSFVQENVKKNQDTVPVYNLEIEFCHEYFANNILVHNCQAFGALKNPISKVQCWSFYPAKLLGSKGDAGAITTNDEKVYEYVKEARNHFKTDNRDFGGNYRMDNLQAALLNVKIQHIPEIIARRKQIANEYFGYLPKEILPSWENKNWQDFIIRASDNKQRDELFNYLKENGIETMVNSYPFTPEYPKLPLTAIYEASTLRIPCNENLIDEEVNYVIEKICQFYTKAKE